MENQNESPDTTWKLLDEQECYPQGKFPISYSNHCPSLYKWRFGLSVPFPKKGMWYQDFFIKALNTGHQKKMWQLVAHAFPAEPPVLCHHEAKLWHADTEKERESWGSQQDIGFVKWDSGKKFKKNPKHHHWQQNLMQRKRQKKTKELSTVFLIKTSSAVVAMAKHNNRTRTHEFRNIWCFVRADWTN